MEFEFIKHCNVNELLIIDIVTVKRSVIFCSSQTAVSFLKNEPGDIFICDECLRLQSNVMNGEDVSRPVSE